MYIRATTNGVLKGYRMNLNKSFTGMNSARNTVLTQRNFNSYAEDVGAASRAFQMRRSLSRVEAQYAVNDDCLSKFSTAYTAIDGLKEILSSRTENSAWSDVLVSLNDPTGDARTQLGQALDQLADTVVQSLNHKYGENFIFAGADGLNVPFSFNSAGQLCYRNVPVDSTLPDLLKDSTGQELTLTLDQNGKFDPAGTALYLQKDKVQFVDGSEVPRVVEANGTPISVDANGHYDATGNGGHYLENNGVQLLTKDAYDKYPDDIQKLAFLTDANGTLVEFNADGSIKDPTDTTQAGGYYLYTQNTEVIEQQPYDDAVAGTKPYNPEVPEGALTDAAGNPIYAKLDADGNIVDYQYTYDADHTHYIILEDNATLTEEEYQNAQDAVEKLKFMANETNYVDIGLGMKENPDAVDQTGKLIGASAFNNALVGINFLGYGKDEDGDPKNIVSLLKEMASLCRSYSDEEWNAENEHYEEVNGLAKKLSKAIDNLDSQYVSLTATTQKLYNNEELLEEEAYNLQEQISNVEDVDMAEAITSFLWANYCYSAALKVGNNILSQSLMDYLN
ncbi:MAG: hypothetical protein HFF50_08975 [Lawsonibacter sp.]|nr:hypothetical protein [Lawsonibacter sp.]